jgi:hypothetical protein
MLQLQAVGLGILFAPRKAFQAYLKGKQSRNFFYEDSPREWLDGRRSVHDLRVYLFPAKFSNEAGLWDYLRYYFFGFLGVLLFIVNLPVYLFPVTLLVIVWWLTAR